jgi:hypothetical protein
MPSSSRSITTDAPRPRSLKNVRQNPHTRAKKRSSRPKTLRLSVFKQTNQENFARISEEGTRECS